MNTIRLHVTSADIERSELQVTARLIACAIAAEIDAIAVVNNVARMLESSLAALQLCAASGCSSHDERLLDKRFWDVVVCCEEFHCTTEVAQMHREDREALEDRVGLTAGVARIRLRGSHDEYIVAMVPAGMPSRV